MEKNLTTGSVFKNVVLFSLPYLLSYFLQTLYGMADLFIIGRFEGVASTTAVSIGSQVMHMLTVMIVGLHQNTFPQILAIVTMAPNNLKYSTQSGICGHWICLWPRLRTFSKIRISAVLRKSCYSKSMQS